MNIDFETFRKLDQYFGTDFEITRKFDKEIVNTKIYVWLLRPLSSISNTFGFDKEIPLFISGYGKLQPRTMQAIEKICGEEILSGRIDTSTAFLFSYDTNLKEWISKYKSENPESRIVVPFVRNDLKDFLTNRWNLVNNIKSVLYISNLFDYKLPLKSDRYFYGRENIVSALIDNAKRNQNSALFGLRKTGKTSVLFKAQRVMEKTKEICTIFIDCKVRQIRNLSCDGLSKKIVALIEEKFHSKSRKSIDSFDDIFECLEDRIRSIPSKKKLCILFDEIEYISPISPTNEHWSKDFIDLWQCLWTIQSRCEKISFIVCGVNPTVCDVDRFPSPSIPGRNIQNPMFSIFNPHYLTGLDYTNLKNMIQFFGSRMGMFFAEPAIKYLFEEYGGHPLLTRLACSFHNDYLVARNDDRPVTIGTETLISLQAERDAELVSYCGHVVSEISELYPAEFEMLCLLAAGQISEFYEKAKNHQAVKHIKDYGLVDFSDNSMPKFKIPVIKRYLEHRTDIGKYLSSLEVFSGKDVKESWLKRRLLSISDDIILLNTELKEKNNFQFYKNESAFQSHHFSAITVVSSQESALSFLVTCHKYLVEPIDKFLKPGGVAKNSDILSNIPNLQDSMMRLKNYRNMFCHVDITEETKRGYKRFLNKDFSGIEPDKIDDGWFKMQKIILDNIHVAIQVEIARL